jgi:hypothetical protein|tara:strand:- start:455 stop:592 length:138 start_codon:yes stop_codon:yes gene_type:complete
MGLQKARKLQIEQNKSKMGKVRLHLVITNEVITNTVKQGESGLEG